MKNSIAKISEILMVGVSVTVLILSSLWIKGYYYLSSLLSIVSAVSLFLYFLPYIKRKWEESKLAEHDDSDEEDVKVPRKRKMDDVEREEESIESMKASIEKKEKLKKKLMDDAEKEITADNFERAADLMAKLEKLNKEIAEAKTKLEEVLKKAEEAENEKKKKHDEEKEEMLRRIAEMKKGG